MIILENKKASQTTCVNALNLVYHDFILTKGENSTHSIQTVISTIFLAPIIEEILCREIAYNPSYLLLRKMESL